MDNHESHKYLPALEFASKNNLIFISLAPHTTHRIQPLDYCVYGPLKIYFEQAIASFQKANLARLVNQYDVAGIFGKAYTKAATVQNAVEDFKKTGVFPPDKYIFNDSDFLPSTVTELDSELAPQVPNSSQDPAPSAASPAAVSLAAASPTVASPTVTSPAAACPTTSYTSPTVIRPLPVASPGKIKRRRKTQKAEILTSSPIRKEQEDRLKNKIERSARKNLKMCKKKIKIEKA